jgi:hypothetical protein
MIFLQFVKNKIKYLNTKGIVEDNLTIVLNLIKYIMIIIK